MDTGKGNNDSKVLERKFNLVTTIVACLTSSLVLPFAFLVFIMTSMEFDVHPDSAQVVRLHDFARLRLKHFKDALVSCFFVYSLHALTKPVSVHDLLVLSRE